ncbi:MAG: carbohydrate kinase family protein [Microterricola sp.]
MTREDAIFIGDVALDEYFGVDDWPALGDKVWAEPRAAELGGMIANAASVHAALGGSTRFLTTMNDGQLSRRLLTELNEQGIDTGLCLVDDSLADSRCLIFLAGEQHVVITPRIGDQRFELDDASFAVLGAARSIYSSIGDLRRLRFGSLSPAEIVRALRVAGARVVLDLDVADLEPGDRELIGATEICFVNRIGFERLADGGAPDAVVTELLAGGMSQLIVTLDADGCIVYNSDGQTAVGGIAASVVDVTGAGDTFCSAFLFAFDRSGDPAIAARFANGAGARATESHGARSGVGTVGDVLEYLTAVGQDTAALAAALLPGVR